MTRMPPNLVLLLLLALTAGTAGAVTRSPERPQAERRIVLADSGISLNQAISMVERRFKARVVRTDVRQEGDRKVYVLRLLNDAGSGQVVRVDAATGAIL